MFAAARWIAIGSRCALALSPGLLLGAGLPFSVGMGRGANRSAAMAIAVLALAGACSPQKPTVTPVATRVAAVAATGLLVDVDLDVYNPNSYPLSAQLVEGTLLLGNGAELGRGAARPPGSIPANGATRVTTRLDIPWLNVAALAPFALSPQPVPYLFRGQATIGGENINIKVPFELNGTLTRDQLIAAGLRGF